MKILLISEYFPPDQVGASTRTLILFEELSKHHNVTLITASPHYPKQKSSIRIWRPIQVIKYNTSSLVIRIWMPTLPMDSFFGRIIDYSLFTFLSTIGIVLAKHPDIIWATSPNVFCGFTGLIASKIWRSKAIANVDDIWPEAPIELGYLKSKSAQWIGKKLAIISTYSVDAISTISDTITLYFQKIMKCKHVFTIPVGIEENRLKEVLNKNKRIGSRDNESSDQITLMYSGILGSAYDFDLLIEAFLLATQQSEKNMKLVIRGNGPLENRIRKKLKIINVESIEFLPGYISTEKLNTLLLSANIFILPMVESFVAKTALPTKLYEYLSFGKPVLIYGTGEPKKFLEQANAGIVCENGGKQAFALKIIKMLESKDLWKKWGENGQKFIVNNFSSNIIGNKAQNMIQTILKSRT